MEEHIYDRLTTLCKVVWGHRYRYEFDVETDERGYYQVFVKKNYGKKCSPHMAMSFQRKSAQEAWEELESFVREMAVMKHTPLDELLRMQGPEPPPPKRKKRQSVKKLQDAQKLQETQKQQEVQRQQEAQRQQDAQMQQEAQKQHYILKQETTQEQEKMYKDRGPLI
ncbi:hypothetical protein N3K66_007816 [Trichothecium roseum]|uniref:Uncharacterized protein n=1 Tax=Trichothecium roseum TaxID=47278 RepID=A0ACC0URN1_9HYPO|nr:hypothetical protein N3K66_007816 [Trichothecium roseum]